MKKFFSLPSALSRKYKKKGGKEKIPAQKPRDPEDSSSDSNSDDGAPPLPVRTASSRGWIGERDLNVGSSRRQSISSSRFPTRPELDEVDHPSGGQSRELAQGGSANLRRADSSQSSITRSSRGEEITTSEEHWKQSVHQGSTGMQASSRAAGHRSSMNRNVGSSVTREQGQEAPKCVICRDDGGLRWKALPCGHSFHAMW